MSPLELVPLTADNRFGSLDSIVSTWNNLSLLKQHDNVCHRNSAHQLFSPQYSQTSISLANVGRSLFWPKSIDVAAYTPFQTVWPSNWDSTHHTFEYCKFLLLPHPTSTWQLWWILRLHVWKEIYREKWETNEICCEFESIWILLKWRIFVRPNLTDRCFVSLNCRFSNLESQID